MARKPRKEKNIFDDLPEDFVAEIDGSTVEAINAKVAELAKAEEENQQAKSLDGDLREKKDLVKYASEGYREATKGYKLRMKYILAVLVSRGKA